MIFKAAEVVNELPIPAEMFGVIAGVIFLIMLLITLSFTNVAQRHARTSGTRGASDGHAPLHDDSGSES